MLRSVRSEAIDGPGITGRGKKAIDAAGVPAPSSEDSRRGVRDFCIGLLIVLATACLVLGLTLPVIRLTHLYLWSDTHSFVSVVHALYAGNEIVLATILVVFSVLFPVLKLVYLLAAYTLLSTGSPHCRLMLSRLSWLGKWSMLDVLVLALVIFYVKASAFSDAAALPGVYFFAASVLLTMLAYALVEHHAAPTREFTSRIDQDAAGVKISNLSVSRTQRPDSAP